MGRMLLLDKLINKAANQVEGFCLVKSCATKNNVKGAPYLDMLLIDAGGEINAKLWDYDASTHGIYVADDIVKVRATINIYKDAEQLKVERIRKAALTDDVDMSDLVSCAPINPEAVFDEILSAVEGFESEELKMLVRYIYNEHRERLLMAPAALKLHHAQRSGLLYHTVTMLRLAKCVCDIYPMLNRDLVYTGIMLHDVAKVDELKIGESGLATAYSPAGQLLGHITMGVDLVGKACEILGTDEETTMLVQHMLLAHHNQPDFGSPRPPMFPEAEVVAEIDMLDSRMFIMFDALSSVRPGEFSERQWALDNRQLYKRMGDGKLISLD